MLFFFVFNRGKPLFLVLFMMFWVSKQYYFLVFFVFVFTLLAASTLSSLSILLVRLGSLGFIYLDNLKLT